MIFVTVGTTDFDDLVRVMDELAPTLGEEVIAQIGRGAYTPVHMEHFRFAPTLDSYYSRARLVVAHGGLGTAIEVLQRGIRLIGVSNPDRYDRHQEDLLGTLERRGHMIWCRSLQELPQALRDAAERSFAPYEAPLCRIAEVIREYLGLPRRG
jgi:UDP-N-acetylglucosamine transferase subunit ALG13